MRVFSFKFLILYSNLFFQKIFFNREVFTKKIKYRAVLLSFSFFSSLSRSPKANKLNAIFFPMQNPESALNASLFIKSDIRFCRPLGKTSRPRRTRFFAATRTESHRAMRRKMPESTWKCVSTKGQVSPIKWAGPRSIW